MDHRFPPLLPKDEIARGPVVTLVAHPDDEVIGAGGMLAFHAGRGDPVTVVHVTDGAGGDPEGRYGDRFAEVRRAEAEAALAELGVADLRCLGLPDGQVPEHADRAAAAVRAVLEELRPVTLYSFFFFEAHRDHRAVGEALVAAADVLPDACRCLLFGVNHVTPAGRMFDVGEFGDAKSRALGRYTSQLGYNEFVRKVECRDFSNTVNVEDASVRAIEVFADLTPDRLARARDLCEPLHSFLCT